MYVGQWPVFDSSKILPDVLKTIWKTKDKCHNLDTGFMLCNNLLCYIYVGQSLSDLYLSCLMTKPTKWHVRTANSDQPVGQWIIFHGPLSLPYILRIIYWTNVIAGILVLCDAKIYLIKYMWVSDLNFMVQWFCLKSWKTIWWMTVVLEILKVWGGGISIFRTHF